MHEPPAMRWCMPLVIMFAVAAEAAADTPGAGSGSAEPPADIAKPAPDAPPDKVKEAKDVAKKAELTPIIPSPSNPTRPAFQLYAELDPPILSIGLVYQLARTVSQQPAYCAPSCEGVYVNWLDRRTAGFYSASWSTASNVELAVLAAGSAGVLVVDEGFLNAVNDAVVIGEAALSASAFATVMTVAAGRPRPFLFGDEAPLEIRNSSDAALSFLSSHTAIAFAIVTSTYVAERRLHPHTSQSRWILGIGLVGASLVGASRVMAGYHFISDTIGGAVVGSSIGFIVSALHKSPVQVVPVVNRDAAGHVSGGGLGLTGWL
jgi:membrane-associated phospholipid phosphatase